MSSKKMHKTSNISLVKIRFCFVLIIYSVNGRFFSWSFAIFVGFLVIFVPIKFLLLVYHNIVQLARQNKDKKGA